MHIVHVRSLLPALLLLVALPITSHAQIGVGVSITVEPPVLPVYEQPPLPEDGYVWTPGFWQWGPDGYFWVPGTWVEPPTVGVLWTPGYWGWGDGAYIFHDGYWGPHVGFYGGVNYGFGYGGVGFEGGEWRGDHLYYNRAVVNVGEVHITNVYNKTVIVNNTTRVSFNGGNGGTNARPTPTEMAAANERHVPRTPEQETHIKAASTNHELLAKVNHGAPPIAATPKPGVFSGKGVVTAHNAPAHAAPEHAAPAAHTETHAPAPAHTPTASHEPVAHPAAARPEAKPMAEHPAPPHAAPAEHAAPPPHAAPAEHAAPPPHAAPAEHAAPAAAPHPQPQHAAPPPKAPPEKKPEEEKR